MKTLYIECNMGAAGDMLLSALMELEDDRDGYLQELNSIGLPNIYITCGKAATHGITGTQIFVAMEDGQEETCVDIDMAKTHMHDHGNADLCVSEHHHTDMHEIGQILPGLSISPYVRDNALQIYGLIADAESKIHGCPVREIHFHEVGNMDAIADIVGVCMLMERIAPDRVVVSPIHVGSGFVQCAHGVLPVPAPATAYILRDVPIYGGSIKGELCTPTGAAILKHFAGSFGSMPEMCIQKVGYGMGKKEFEIASFVRVFLGSVEDEFKLAYRNNHSSENVCG
jgi:uncharacterized protein (TIGR00299 family) protein